MPLMETNGTKPCLVIGVLEPALVLALECSDVRPVPLDGLPAHRAHPDDLRLFGHGKPRCLLYSPVRTNREREGVLPRLGCYDRRRT